MSNPNTHSPKIVTLSSQVFSERAVDAIEAQPVRKTVHLAEIDLIDDEKISYKGASLNISKSAFGDLSKF